jgi:hypothetical protein
MINEIQTPFNFLVGRLFSVVWLFCGGVGFFLEGFGAGRAYDSSPTNRGGK